MKVLVCGSRNFTDYERAEQVLSEIHKNSHISEIIHGGARGGDQCGALYAGHNEILCTAFLADWRRHGRRAGILRNERMLNEGAPDLVVAFWDGKSPGTKHMINISKDAGIPVKIEYFK